MALDIANAFDTQPYRAISQGLEKYGIPAIRGLLFIYFFDLVSLNMVQSILFFFFLFITTHQANLQGYGMIQLQSL